MVWLLVSRHFKQKITFSISSYLLLETAIIDNYIFPRPELADVGVELGEGVGAGGGVRVGGGEARVLDVGRVL